MILPTLDITETGQVVEVDGVKMVFQMTPGTEAPAEMNTWFPQFKALWMAENTTNTMHNVLTLRGAQVRDPLKWATYIDETIDLWGGDVQVKFQSHHWPQWGNAGIIDYFGKQRDIYKYTHDQSVRLMNMGYNGEEISEMIKLPASLENEWSTRGYYGTLRHNSRAVYQRYMGWYNGNPSDLNNLPPEMVGATLCQGHGRRSRGHPQGPGVVRAERLPLGCRTDETRGVRQSRQHRSQEPVGRRLRAAGLPGRVRPVALGLPARCIRTAQRRAAGRRARIRLRRTPSARCRPACCSTTSRSA